MTTQGSRLGRALAITFLMLSSSLLWLHTDAAAQDGEVDAAWPSGERQVTVRTNQAFTSFNIVSTRATENTTDRIAYEFRMETMTLTTTFESLTPENVTGLRSNLTFNSLIEYEDVDRDGQYGLTDRFIKQILFKDMNFGRVEYQGEKEGRHEVYARWTLPEFQQGTAEIFFAVTEEGGNGTNLRQRPTDLSFRVVVERFTYRNPTNSSLALDVRVGPAPEIGGDHITTTRDPFHLVHRWNGTALAGRLGALEPVTVAATMQRYSGASPDQVLLAFSYPAATRIEHKSSVHVERHLPPEEDLPEFEVFREKIIGEWRLFSVGLLIAIIAIGGATYPRLRRRW